MYDFSKSEPAKSEYDLIPAKTVASAVVAVRAGEEGTPENAFTISKNGLMLLALEFTITDGPFAKRKIFQRFTMGAADGVELTEGQAKAVAIAGSFVRSLLEAGRGVDSTDESPAAIKARQMSSIFELDGLEVMIEVGIEKDKTGAYSDRNKVARVTSLKAAAGAKPAGAKPAGIVKPAAAPATKAKAAWS